MQIILHIGQQKTASTLIQLTFDRNRERLAAQGVLYPTSLGLKKSFIAPFISRRGHRRGLPSSDETILSALRTEFAGGCDRAVLSDETIYGWGPDKKRTLKQVFGEHAASWRVLCYLRRPDEHIVSHYQQLIRNLKGFHDDFDAFLAKRMRDDYYRYAWQMERWEDVFGEGSVEVRVFDRRTLQGGPTEDFMRWIGLDPGTIPADEQVHANESLDRAGTEILRFLGLCQEERPGLVGGFDLGQVRRRLRALASDDRLRLDTARARRLQDRFREDHERLARRHLPPDHAAILLAPPAERAPQPPVGADVLYARMVEVLEDPAFARMAADEIANGARRGSSRAASMLPSPLRAVLDKARRVLRAS